MPVYGPALRLLFQKAAILLEATIPATRFHAQRLARSAGRHAGSDRRAVRALVATRNADSLLAAAPHGRGHCDLAVDHDKTKKAGNSTEGSALREADPAGAPRVRIHRQATFQLLEIPAKHGVG